MAPDAHDAAIADDATTTTSPPATTSPSPATAAAAVPGNRQVIRWDQILPRRSLRVLLVEHDDSTRHIVAALLRKCSYHVAAVADGMKAWEVLRERGFAFDLVLTEVAMPTLSGIGLLSRIVAAEECKNIPVIMMSSQDSIGVVLKCMLKGAVDFLVKPVRKNELRNLWQHVWRRHCMNSQANASENNAASNHISVNAGNGSKTGENSDEGSDAQSSGSKREMDIQSVEKIQEIVTAEGAGSSREFEEKQEGPYGGITMKACVSKTSDDKPSESAFDINRTPVYSAEKNVDSKCLDVTTSFAEDPRQFTENASRAADMSSHLPIDPSKDLLAFSGPTADRKCNSSAMEKNAVGKNALCKDSICAAKGKAESCPSQLLEITLGKQQLNGYSNQNFREKDIFNHSNSSAFSRYADKRIQSSVQQPFFSSLCIGHRESVDNEKNSSLQSNGMLPSHQHNTGESTMHIQVSLDSNREGVAILCSTSAREDAGTSNSSPGKDTLNHPHCGFIPVPIPVGAAIPYQNFCAPYGAILQPIYYPQTSFVHCSSAAIEKAVIQHAPGQSNYHENLGNPPQFDEHHWPEENQQLHHSRQIHRESGEPIELTSIPVEQVNQSAGCSQDIRKGSGCSGSGETADANTNTMVALESGNESGVQNCSSKGLDSDQSRREAALIKFRMKRKERCFEKKVRYHSRKKLAEQRPRMKGQFVSQKLKSAAATDAETD